MNDLDRRPHRESTRRELCLAAGFLVVWVLVPFWRIATLRAVNVQDDIYASDLLNDRLPARAFVGGSLRRGELPVWVPGIYTGFPSLAQVEMGAAYPSNLILFGVLSPYTAIAWAQILPLLIAGFGTFMLAGQLGVAFEGRLLAAGVFALSGFLIAHLRQLNMVDAAAWVPLLAACTERIATGRAGRAPMLLAIVWAMQLLAGHPQISYYTALVLGVYLFARAIQVRGRRTVFEALRRALPFCCAIFLGTFLAAVQILPALELVRLTYREGGLSYADAAKYAASPLGVWTFWIPDLFGDARTDSFRLSGIHWEQYAYVGVLPVLLTLVALVVARRSPRVLLLAGGAVASYLMVLGPNTPFFGWAHAVVPGMSFFRFPTRFLLFVDLAIALLAGFGLAACLAPLPKAARRLAAAAALTLTAGDLWVHQMRQVPQVDTSRWTAPIDSHRMLATALAADPGPWRYYSLDAPLVHAQTYHAAGGWSGDLSPYVALRSLLQPSFNLLFDLESPDGYSNLVPRYYEAVWGSEKKVGVVPRRHLETGELEPEFAKTLRLFNVRYLLSRVPIRSEELRSLGRSNEGVELHELHDPLPRAFVVERLVPARDDAEALKLMTNASFDPTREAVVDGSGPSLPEDAASSREVRILRRGNTEVAVRASLDRPGLLVLSEGYYPGWRVTVDGTDAELWRVNLMMRGVSLPAGEHEVVFRFRSSAIRIGGALSMIAALALFALRHRLVIAA